ncbi:tumor necrosis factor receptor superfamily member 27 isoform X22 [Homo sapiens]|uniref:tumor necrosis factor receptor superfamily member 27 isoform X22 n=1 Tax=Homo sapiens TaxID=9606 RepID=UPI0023DFF122|nr:tumor necrosis factor receptor superfamily member 27 isoform X22 [Homo sapiens]
MDCQENEYWDQWGRCVTCQRCGPGQELSKDCGYGEGGDAYCTACPPRRYKSSWGHHKCQSCITCAVINRVQKVNCTATSNAVCGDCLPRCLPVELSGGRCTHSAPSGGHTCCTGEQPASGVYPGLPGALLPLLQAVLQQTLPAWSLGPLAALPSCSLWTLFLYHNSSRGLKCDVHKS